MAKTCKCDNLQIYSIDKGKVTYICLDCEETITKEKFDKKKKHMSFFKKLKLAFNF